MFQFHLTVSIIKTCSTPNDVYHMLHHNAITHGRPSISTSIYKYIDFHTYLRTRRYDLAAAPLHTSVKASTSAMTSMHKHRLSCCTTSHGMGWVCDTRYVHTHTLILLCNAMCLQKQNHHNYQSQRPPPYQSTRSTQIDETWTGLTLDTNTTLWQHLSSNKLTTNKRLPTKSTRCTGTCPQNDT